MSKTKIKSTSQNSSKWLPMALLLAVVFSTAGQAQAGIRWHGDIRSFHVHDYPIWRTGHWAHRWYHGNWGWYWIVGTSYYMFPRPVYPYPDPYVPPTVIVQQPPQVIYQQPPVVVQQQPPVVVQQPPNTDIQPQVTVPPGSVPPPPAKTVSMNTAPAPATTWYHCEKPEGYYPYIANCPAGWNPVPATPPQ